MFFEKRRSVLFAGTANSQDAPVRKAPPARRSSRRTRARRRSGSAHGSTPVRNKIPFEEPGRIGAWPLILAHLTRALADRHLGCCFSRSSRAFLAKRSGSNSRSGGHVVKLMLPPGRPGWDLALSSGHLDRRAARHPRQPPASSDAAGVPSRATGRHPRNAWLVDRVSAWRLLPRAALALPPGSTRRRTRPHRCCCPIPTTLFAVRSPPKTSPSRRCCQEDRPHLSCVCIELRT